MLEILYQEFRVRFFPLILFQSGSGLRARLTHPARTPPSNCLCIAPRGGSEQGTAVERSWKEHKLLCFSAEEPGGRGWGGGDPRLSHRPLHGSHWPRYSSWHTGAVWNQPEREAEGFDQSSERTGFLSDKICEFSDPFSQFFYFFFSPRVLLRNVHRKLQPKRNFIQRIYEQLKKRRQ